MTAPNLSSRTTIRVALADDQALIRDGLATILALAPDIDVVAIAENGRDVLQQINKLANDCKPQVTLLDLQMPVLDGIGATKELLSQYPEMAIIVLTTYQDDASISAALAAGARSYLTKDAGRDRILAAIRSTASGQATFDVAVARRLISGLKPSKPSFPELTERESEILALIAAGRNNQEIARESFVSVATVKTHINNIFAKLQLRDRAQAITLWNSRAGR